MKETISEVEIESLTYHEKQKILMDHYGFEETLKKTSEELNELLEVIDLAIETREIDTERFIDESADVFNMLDKLFRKFSISSNVEERMLFKVDRQIRRIKK